MVSAGGLWRTLRYLTPQQILYQGLRRAQRPFRQTAPYRRWATRSEFSVDYRPLPGLRRLPRPKLSFEAPNKVTFFGITREFGDWNHADASLLWRFNLHYFDYLREIGDVERAEAVIRSWLREVPVGELVAWHSFPLSLRIVNWIRFVSDNQKKLEPDFVKRVNQSLRQQVAWLNRHREYEILANHLFENARALVIGALYLGAQKLLRDAETLLLQQLREQILPDGGHYERSPMYHAIVLEGCCEIIQAYRSAGVQTPPQVLEVVRRMRDFLARILVCGEFPPLNDSSPDMAPDPQALCGLASELLGDAAPVAEPVFYAPESGIFLHRGARWTVLYDVGFPGPPYQCGHAHSDLLSVLVWLDGEPLMVDSGTPTYEPGAMREYFRSSRAHSVPGLRGVDQNEFWKSFRVGRRALPHNVRVDREPLRIFGEHDGYQHLNASVQREVQIQEGRISIIDTIRGGSAFERETNYIFSPSISPRILRSTADEVEVVCGKAQCRIVGDQLSAGLEEAPIAAAFGATQPGTKLVLRWRGDQAITTILTAHR